MRGEGILSYHRNVRSEMAGALTVLGGNHNVEVILGYSARGITSGGTLAGPAFSQLAAEFFDSVSSAQAIDGIYFALHGSLTSENEPDVEGYLLAETRRIVGDKFQS